MDAGLDAAATHGITLHLRRGRGAARSVQPDISKVENQPDLFIAASGLSGARGAPHATWACLAALEIRQRVELFAEGDGEVLPGEIRLQIGVASGPVAGGLNGTGALVYSVYGSTVNLSSRVAHWGAAAAFGGESDDDNNIGDNNGDNNGDNIGDNNGDNIGDNISGGVEHRHGAVTDGMAVAAPTSIHVAATTVQCLRGELTLPFFKMVETADVELKGIAGTTSVFGLTAVSRIGIEIADAALERLAKTRAQGQRGLLSARLVGGGVPDHHTGVHTGRSMASTGRGTHRATYRNNVLHRESVDVPNTEEHLTPNNVRKVSYDMEAHGGMGSGLGRAMSIASSGLGENADAGAFVLEGKANAALVMEGGDPVLEELISSGAKLVKEATDASSAASGIAVGNEASKRGDELAVFRRPVGMCITVVAVMVVTVQVLTTLEARRLLPEVNQTGMIAFAAAMGAATIVMGIAFLIHRAHDAFIAAVAVVVALGPAVCTGLYLDDTLTFAISGSVIYLSCFVVTRKYGIFCASLPTINFIIVIAMSFWGPITETKE
jgi:hypothetical protein